MAEKKATVPFSGTKEQEEALMKVIHELKDEKRALMPILQKAQDIWVSSDRSSENDLRRDRYSDGEDLWSGNILFTVHIESERKIQDFRLSWNGMLCKRIGRYLQCFDGKVRYCRRRMYAGRKVFS